MRKRTDKARMGGVGVHSKRQKNRIKSVLNNTHFHNYYRHPADICVCLLCVRCRPFLGSILLYLGLPGVAPSKTLLIKLLESFILPLETSLTSLQSKAEPCKTSFNFFKVNTASFIHSRQDHIYHLTAKHK